MRIRQNLILSVVMMSCLFSCKRDEKFEDLGTKFAGPIDVAVSDDSQYFYVLNADIDRTYDTGSIVVMDTSGNKLTAIDLPRLGRSLTVAGDDMIVTFDTDAAGVSGQIALYSLKDPKNPQLVKYFDPLCDSPLNAVMVKGYKYFSVACRGGFLLSGVLTDNRADSKLYLVRQFAQNRRAMYIDPKRNLLFAFVSDLGAQRLVDRVMEDSRHFADTDPTPDGVAGANEIPDELENSKRARDRLDRKEVYQYVVYNYAKEAEKGFPNLPESNPAVAKELRYLYFKLTNFDGTPDPAVTAALCGDPWQNPNCKEYRTNFWAARANPLDADSFYLSHRGGKGAQHATEVVKVTITGDLNLASDAASPPATSDVLSFERVYGFRGELDPNPETSELHFPGDFQVRLIGGQPLLVINHFRDLYYWNRGEVRFSIAAKVLGENSWLSEQITSDPINGYYQVAVTDAGKALSCSFYGNATLMFDIKPGANIEPPVRIE